MEKSIKVKNDVPEYGVRVLVWSSDEPDEPWSVDELEAKIESEKGIRYKWRFGNLPTHWMPLPNLPKL